MPTTRRGAETLDRTVDDPARPASRSWLAALAVLAILGGAVPLLIASHFGALGIPRGDDWSYLLTLFRWVDRGRLGFNNWAATVLIGQVAIAAPVAWVFRRSIEAVHILSAVVGVVALCAVVAAGRTYVTFRAAVFVALSIAVSPLWMPMAPTFMSDHWAFAAEMLALACALVAFRRTSSSTRWLVASVTFGFLGVAIRQYAIVGVVAILLAALADAGVRRDRRQAQIVVALAAVFVLATVTLLAWWSGRPGIEGFLPSRSPVSLVAVTVRTELGYMRLLGLLLAPTVVLARPREIVSAAWRASRGVSLALSAVVGGALLVDFALAPGTPFVGDYVARSGVLGLEAGLTSRIDVIPATAFDALVWIGTASFIVVLLRAVPFLVSMPRLVRERSWPDASDSVLGLNIVGFVVVTTASVLADTRGFDRYVLPILPLAAFAVLRGRLPAARVASRRTSALATVAVGLLALVGIAFAVDSASFDATRWDVARRATQQGYRPVQVDGGFEWVGWHRRTAPPYGPKLDPVERRRRRAAFDALFCVRVAIVSHTRPRQIVARAVSRAPTRPSEVIVAFRLPRPCRARVP